MTIHKRVAHLTTVHTRYDIRVFRKECTTLAKYGWDTHLIVADGKGNELKSDISIHDVGKPTHRFRRMCITPWKVLRLALSLKADIYHFHDPELIPVALWLTARGKRVIYDAHEDVPRQITSKPWIPTIFRASVAFAFEILENFAARRFSALVAATPHIADRFIHLNPATVAINNFPLREEMEIAETITPPIRDRERAICYVGGITRIRGAVEMVRAMEYVDGRLILAGPMQDQALEAELRRLPGWKRVDYRGEVSRAGVRQIFKESRLGILPFLPVPNHLSAQPNKMFEYMSAGLPIVAADFPLWRSLLIENNIALVADPTNVPAFAAAIQELLNDPARSEAMGRNGLRMVSSSYNWDTQKKILLDLYDSLAARDCFPLSYL